MAGMSNGPFHIFLSSPDGGISLALKILDNAGRVHRDDSFPMPDFAGGSAARIELDLAVEGLDAAEPKLEALPVDPSVVTRRLGGKFVQALREEDED